MPVERGPDRLDRARGDVVPLANQVGQLPHHGAPHGHVLVGAVEGEHVAAQEDLAVEVLLEGPHDRVAGTGELGGDVVGELELRAHYAVSFSLTRALTRFPSARPLTFGITIAITLPISFGEDAPDSATASPTSASSSSSPSCCGR